MPRGIPKNGKRKLKVVGSRRKRKLKVDAFIAPSFSRFETKVLYKRLRSLPRAGIGVREGAAVSSILAKVTEAVISRD